MSINNSLNEFNKLNNIELQTSLAKNGYARLKDFVKERELNGTQFLKLTEIELYTWKIDRTLVKAIWNCIVHVKNQPISFIIEKTPNGKQRATKLEDKVFFLPKQNAISAETGDYMTMNQNNLVSDKTGYMRSNDDLRMAGREPAPVPRDAAPAASRISASSDGGYIQLAAAAADVEDDYWGIDDVQRSKNSAADDNPTYANVPPAKPIDESDVEPNRASVSAPASNKIADLAARLRNGLDVWAKSLPASENGLFTLPRSSKYVGSSFKLNNTASSMQGGFNYEKCVLQEIKKEFEETQVAYEEPLYDIAVSNYTSDPFYCNITRQAAILLLQDCKIGAFLFRKSSSSDDIVLSVKTAKKVANFQINVLSNQQLIVKSDGLTPKFATLQKLREYYKTTPLSYVSVNGETDSICLIEDSPLNFN